MIIAAQTAVGSSVGKRTFCAAAKPLRATLHLLAGALLSSLAVAAALAQGDPDYSRLIFEVAPIPADGTTQPGTAASGAGSGVDAKLGASAQADTPNLNADISAYRARIADLQATDNPYSVALREQFDALGSLLQQNGDHEEAIAAFESAMHIDRVNAGLYTLDQIPVVEKLIASHEALGNADEVHDFHAYLFYIQQKNYPAGDPRRLVAMEDWADWNVESYMRRGAPNPFVASYADEMDYVAVQNRDGTYTYVPRAQMLNVLNPLGTGAVITDPSLAAAPYGVQAERLVDERLRTARMYYEQILEAQSDNDDASDASNVAIERKLANVAYAVKELFEDIDTVSDRSSLANSSISDLRRPPPLVTRSYQDLRDTFEANARELEQNAAATTLEKAQAWIQVGDWYVGFDQATRGSEAYRKAWELLSESGMDPAAIAAVFMPQALVYAPAFVTHPFSREIYGITPDAPLAYRGYMDMTLNVSRYGDVSGIRIDTTSPGTSQLLRRELLDYLREQKVRPAIDDGELVERRNVALRYYYSY